jgi:hypothetical protein
MIIFANKDSIYTTNAFKYLMLLELKVLNVSLFLLQREYFEKQILKNFEL